MSIVESTDFFLETMVHDVGASVPPQSSVDSNIGMDYTNLIEELIQTSQVITSLSTEDADLFSHLDSSVTLSSATTSQSITRNFAAVNANDLVESIISAAQKEGWDVFEVKVCRKKRGVQSRSVLCRIVPALKSDVRKHVNLMMQYPMHLPVIWTSAGGM